MPSTMASIMGGARPCRHCRYYDGLAWGGPAALCKHPMCPRVRSRPEDGCSSWEREPGSDDDIQEDPPPAAT